jgi:type I restriction enzyme S subunit
LRFPEFQGEWETVSLESICDKIGDGIHSTPNYDENGDSFFINGNNLVGGRIQISETTKRVTRKEAEQHNTSHLAENAILISINGTIGNLALYNNEQVMLGKSACYINLKIGEDRLFVFYQLGSKRIYNYFIAELTGSTIKNLSLKSIRQTVFHLPSTEEQEKVGRFFSLLDERIETQNKIIEDLKLLKSTIRHTLFTQIDKSNAETKRIKDILDYEQPTKYIVENTDYQNDVSLVPVLTANKAFVLGYTSENYGIYDKGDCIIFDDFTMDLKYANFPFKVKSSAIKILTSRSNINLKYIFEYLSFLDLTSSDHKRHYISEVESMPIHVPEIEKQNIFSNLFSVLDEKIVLESHHYDLLTAQKQYLLSQLFI